MNKKKLIENFISLATLQGFNFLLPLITLPFLVRVLGPEHYGQIAFAQSFNQLLIYITDYGFNLSATKQISIHRESKDQLNKIFSSVLIVKILLFILCSIIVLLLVIFVPIFRDSYMIFVIFLGMTFGNVIFPIWFFQGIEKMKYITILSVLSKTIFTIGIFVFVRGIQDILMVPLFYSLGFIVIGLYSQVLIYKKFNIRLKKLSITDIKVQFKDGWSVFLSTISFSLYTVSNTFILGLISNNTIVGYYASAEKIVNAAISVISPISDTLYPHINNLAIKSREAAINLIKKSFFIIIGITGFIGIIFFTGSKLIITILYGEDFQQSVYVLRILAFVPVLIGMMNVFGVQSLLTFGYKKEFSRVMVFSCVFNIILSIFLVNYFEHIGTAVSVLTTNLIIAFSLVVISRKKGVKIPI